MKEDASERAAKYIENATRMLRLLEIRKPLAEESAKLIDTVVKLAKNYSSDASHYLTNNQPVTSLACVSYAEGLLDALKFLGLIEVRTIPGLQSSEMPPSHRPSES